MNKYLIKVASLQGDVKAILTGHKVRHDEIEAPIDEMYAAFDDLDNQYRVNNPGLDIARNLGVSELSKFYTEQSMRKAMGTDRAHAENSMNTAKALLALREINAAPDEYQSNRIIKELKNMPYESNGYRTTKSLGTVMGTLAGGAAGVALGRAAANPLATIGGGVAGAIAGGVGTNLGLGAMLNKSIDRRDHDIYDARERAMEHAYDNLRTRFSK